MLNQIVRGRLALSVACLLGIVSVVHAAGLEAGDHVAIVGDSITEQRQYSVFLEDYLLMCQPAPKLSTTQFGWGGETSWGFLARMDFDFAPFKSTVATTVYGMNDGGYGPMTDEKAKHYRDAMTSIVEKMKKEGVRFIVVGSPGCVDSTAFKNKPDLYNTTLAGLRDIAKEVAQAQGVAFADVHDPMMDVMAKAKAKYGKEYDLAGPDGVHPNSNGHLVMAYALLKGLGVSGDIGTITFDAGAATAQATEGHRVLSANAMGVELESTRYPFCFAPGDPKFPSSTRGILEFFPFNQDLNRLTFKVVNGKGAHYKVTWGKTSKEFSATDLSAGINLAAEFLDNPFSEAFAKVDQAVHQQQSAETPLIKGLLFNLPQYRAAAPEEAEAFNRIEAKLVESDKPLCNASSSAVVPVRHTIKIEALP